MVDIKLNSSGDIEVSDLGDFFLTNSILQAVKIRLRWIYNEWRLGPQYGFPWFEEVFVKNPNILKIKGLLRSEIMRVDGVKDASVDDVMYDTAARRVTIRYTVFTSEGRHKEEVTLHG